jgi:hypothetical protein
MQKDRLASVKAPQVGNDPEDENWIARVVTKEALSC